LRSPIAGRALPQIREVTPASSQILDTTPLLLLAEEGVIGDPASGCGASSWCMDSTIWRLWLPRSRTARLRAILGNRSLPSRERDSKRFPDRTESHGHSTALWVATATRDLPLFPLVRVTGGVFCRRRQVSCRLQDLRRGSRYSRIRNGVTGKLWRQFCFAQNANSEAVPVPPEVRQSRCPASYCEDWWAL